MKLISWNVNGVRAVIRKGALEALLADEDPDLLCLQETKARPEQVELDLPGYHAAWHSAEKKGYSGTLTLSKAKPLTVRTGLTKTMADTEGRVLLTEFERFQLINVYVPNAKRDLSRLEYRQGWDKAFLAHARRLTRKKPVVFCGDLNVAHEEIDLWNPKGNHKTHGFTPEERAGFEAMVRGGFVDAFRQAHPEEPDHYTWWSQMGTARAQNKGWRIDYFLVDATIAGAVTRAWIRPDVTGSDHCPVGLELDLA